MLTQPPPCILVPICPPLVGEHVEEHPDGIHCRGCKPRPAALPWTTCTRCAREFNFLLAELWAYYQMLLTPTRTAGGSAPSWAVEDDDAGRTTGPGLRQTTAPGGDRYLGLRHEIRQDLWAWCARLDRTLPDYEVGTIIRHLADYIADILITPYAADFLPQLRALVAKARAVACPSTPMQKLGDCPECGHTVRAATLDGEVTCRGCGAVRTVEGWKAVMDGDLTSETSAPAELLIEWLNTVHRAGITAGRFRYWVSAGVKVNGSLVKVARLGTDPRSRALYSVADATRIAAHLYGQKATA